MGLRVGGAPPDRPNLIRVMPAQGATHVTSPYPTAALPRLQLITPELASCDLDAVIRSTITALGAGARWLQIRSKALSDAELFRCSEPFELACAEFTATLVIDDRVDLAMALGADGVHVGADDLPVNVVREIIDPDAIVGATARSVDEAKRAEDDGATYLGVGPVFVSASKAATVAEPIGVRGVEQIAGAVSLPVFAISGVEVDHVADLLSAGAWGVAVINAVYGAADVAAAVDGFLTALGEEVFD